MLISCFQEAAHACFAGADKLQNPKQGQYLLALCNMAFIETNRCHTPFSATRTRRARLCYALPINKEATMRGAPGGIIGLLILVVIIIVVLRLLGVV